MDRSIINHFNVNAKSVVLNVKGDEYPIIQEKNEADKQEEAGTSNGAAMSKERSEKKKIKKGETQRQISWQTDLNRMLEYEENVAVLHGVGDLYQAVGVHDWAKDHDLSQREIGFLMRYCLSLMLTNHEVQANKVFEKILTLVRSLGETFLSVLSLAEKYSEQNKDFDTIMLSLIAAKMADLNNVTFNDGVDKLKCMQVLRTAAGNVSENTKQAKPFLRRYCVEAVRPLFENIQQIAFRIDIRGSLIRLKIATFHSLEILLLYADDDHERAVTLERALKFMRETYKEEVYHRKWFGNFSHNLGIAYTKLSRHGEAVEVLFQAINSFQQAIDFDDENEKLQDMTRSREMLSVPSLGGLVIVDD